MKTCFLCDSSEKLIEFNDESLQKCKLMLSFRKKMNFKYNNITINSESHGYHLQCYKKFTVVKKKYKEEFLNYSQMHTKQSTSSIDEVQSNMSIAVNVKNIYVDESMLTSDLTIGSDYPVDNSTNLDYEDLNQEVPSTSTPMKSTELSATISTASLSTPGKKLPCMFCQKVEKKVGSRRAYVKLPKLKQTMDEIKKIATVNNDERIIEILEHKEHVAYHGVCLTSYQVTAKRQTADQPEPDLWHENRALHKKAFDSLSVLIAAEIIEKRKVMFLVDLLFTYKALLMEFRTENVFIDDVKKYRMENLEVKITNAFGNSVIIENSSDIHKKKIVYMRDINLSELATKAANLQSKEVNKLEHTAYELRNSIKSIKCKKLPEKLTADDVIKGECEIPDKLFDFMCNLIQGPDIRRKNCEEDFIKIKSLCSDIIYTVTKGKIKPSKNLMLGLAMKSLTSSRKVISILNKYGHCVGYNLVEEIETEMTYTAHEENKIVPSGIDAVKGRSTHVAFDNFDRFVDTSSGKDTLHDTVGIVYQFTVGESSEFCEDTDNVDDETMDTSTNSVVDENNSESSSRPRKRRRFQGVVNEIRPYYRQPAQGIPLLSASAVTDFISECKYATEIAMDKDLMWIMLLSRFDSIPMWLAYNCKFSSDNSQIQIIEYLPPINASPTSDAVVHKTLELTSQIAENCKQDNIIVTYDLAIAKIALQIQEALRPKFDHIFVNMGAFHIQIAFFRALGKYVDSSGLIDILIKAEVLGVGSTNNFIDSKHFNRCRRLHPLISAALQILHFEQYLSQLEDGAEMSRGNSSQSENDPATLDENLSQIKFDPYTFNDDLYAFMNNLCNQILPDGNEAMLLPDALEDIFNGYKQYCTVTLSGGHGKTAQYFFQYTQLVNLFLRFSRSIRCSDYELYLDSLFNISDLFFALNQPNYARYSILYLSNLMKLKTEQSPLLSEFRRGAFGVRRTKAKFARSPVDLSLEQTINADAGNTLTGITHFTNSISARQKWALSHSMRTKILTAVKKETGLLYEDDTSHCLQKNQTKKDKLDLNRIIAVIKDSINPFDSNVDENSLFNISTGKAAPQHVTDFLLNILSLGNKQKMGFITECVEKPERFVKPIRKNKILNFASECIKKSQRSRDGSKRILLKMERDVFGRLLAIGLKKKIDLEYCLTYPLAPAPPALFQCSGDMFKTPKSKLADHLKSQINLTNPSQIDVEVIDGFYFLHLIGSYLPQTFGKVAESILKKLCSTSAHKIHLIFDRYLVPSIKDCERENRSEINIPYTINGPLQPRPTNFLESLKNRNFKEALINFLANYWENDDFATVLLDKIVFITVEEQCFSFSSDRNRVIKSKETDLNCKHEEADTRIMFHISKAPPKTKILVKANDTDVLIILLGNIHKVPDKEIWMAGTTSQKNSTDQSCINCTQLALKLGSELCLALPAFHAFSGCDYTAAFYSKGKIRPFKLFSKNKTFQRIFASLTDAIDVFDEEKMKIVQEFTALMYGVKKCTDVNSARYNIFQKKYSASRSTDHFLKNVKAFDSKLIPPCWRSLKQKVLRTIFVNSMWTKATDPCCVSLNPEHYGYSLIGGTLKPTWFIGDPTPMTVEDILSDSNDNNFEDKEVADDPLNENLNILDEINLISEDEEEDDDDDKEDVEEQQDEDEREFI